MKLLIVLFALVAATLAAPAEEKVDPEIAPLPPKIDLPEKHEDIPEKHEHEEKDLPILHKDLPIQPRDEERKPLNMEMFMLFSSFADPDHKDLKEKV
ncbi:hypothetical protein, partial [Microbacterium aurugineum]|uniref:hypothetical protein n=1 Tax=Microbacterium aurugineum TaxID=2851642 RepID=UPI0039BDED73